jgi:hypothetical protein
MTRAEINSVDIESACVGCEAPMTYVCETSGAGNPMVEPKESRSVAHSHGHICASCAGHVAVLFERLREDRRRLQGAR